MAIGTNNHRWMMKALKLSLMTSSLLLAVGMPCFGAENAVTNSPKEQVKPANQENPEANAGDEDEDVEIIEVRAEKENPEPSYPFGQPVIKEDSAKGGWTVNLPGRGLNIQSQWPSEPHFKVEANTEGKYEGAVSLTAIKKPDPGSSNSPMAALLVYVYEPASLKLDTNNPASVIKTLIDEPAEKAREIGLLVKVDKLSGKSEKTGGMLEDTRRKIVISEKVQKPKKVENAKADKDAAPEMETVEEAFQTQFYRMMIGKDYVVLGLVMGGADASEKDAQKFLDSISLQPSQAAQPPATAPKKG